MCVICYKPKGERLPDKTIFEAMMDTNPHGFGYVTPREVYHTMDAEEFERHFYANVRRGEPCLIHFRIATHGSVREANCHPFTDEALGVSFMHNGVLALRPEGDKTDSETAFRGVIVPAIRKYGYLGKGVAKAVDKVIGGSRFAMMDGEGRVQMFGQYTKFEGLFFSNMNWLRHMGRPLFSGVHSFKFA